MPEGGDRNTERPQPLLNDAERLRLIEQSVKGYAIFVVDIDGRIASWNAGATRILGYEEEEVIGEPFPLIFIPEDRASGAPEKELTGARQNGQSENERLHLRKDGSRLWVSGILTALRDDEGNLQGYAKILRDITERKQAQEQIQALNQRLNWAMLETDHRVKNNLQILSSLIDLQTVGRTESVPVSEYKRLSNQIRTLAAIHDILTADTQEDGDAISIPLPSLLENVLDFLQSTAGRTRIERQIDDARMSTRRGTSLALITNELLQNAIKYGSGAIRIRLKAERDNAVLEVCDNGPGFPPGFDPNTAAHTGLALVANLTRLDLKGTVRYFNSPQGGGCASVAFHLDKPEKETR